MVDRVAASGSRRASTVVFFATVLGLSFGCGLPAALATIGAISGPPDRFLPFLGIVVLSPTIAAVVASLYEGEGALRRLWSKLRPQRIKTWWYLVALGANSLIVAGACLLANLLGEYHGRLFFPPTEPSRLVALVLLPIAEEVGWRGFALPRLLDRMSSTRASVWLGIAWGAWHVPFLLVQGVSWPLLLPLVLFFVPGSIVMTSLHERTRGSLLIAILFHMGAHVSNPHQLLPNDAAPAMIQLGGYLLVAFGIAGFSSASVSSKRRKTGRRR
ncbi:MAG: CPBP family intramembrane metalloprotease [Deltaproteobacteria bacterium]|nr:CPBP family intramembrane metalloprotease [Deltaproteobacteria bacterium]